MGLMDSAPFPYDQFESPGPDPVEDVDPVEIPQRPVARDVKIAAATAVGVAGVALGAAWVLASVSNCTAKGPLGCLEMAVLIAFGVPLFAFVLLWQTLKLFRLAWPGVIALATLITLVVFDLVGIPVFSVSGSLMPKVILQFVLVAAVTGLWTAVVDGRVNRSWNPAGTMTRHLGPQD
jgi:hypothetical protein